MSWRVKVWITTALLTSAVFTSFGQQADTLIHKLDSLGHKTDRAGGQVNNISENAYNSRTDLDPRTYFLLLGSNFKQAITKPFHMKGHDWFNLGKFALVEGALAFADEPLQKFAVDLTDRSPSVRHVSKYVTNFGAAYEVYTLAGFAAYGVVFKNKKALNTTLLATQAYITGTVIERLVKTLTGRTRPYIYPPGTEAEPTFYGPFSNKLKTADGKTSYSSFPSGHTTVAFAAATVFAMEYRDKLLYPIVAYTAASLVGFSRITENKHWITDVVAGAALGYLTGRQVVNNYHRYSKLKAPHQPRNTVSFQLGYGMGGIMPGIVYHIR